MTPHKSSHCKALSYRARALVNKPDGIKIDQHKMEAITFTAAAATAPTTTTTTDDNNDYDDYNYNYYIRLMTFFPEQPG